MKANFPSTDRRGEHHRWNASSLLVGWYHVNVSKRIREVLREMHAAMITAKCFQPRNEHFQSGNLNECGALLRRLALLFALQIQQAIGPHEDLLTIVKRRKLQWYGHVSRSSGLAKTILQGTVKRGRRQGGQRKSGKTTLGNRQAWSSASPRRRWRTGKNGENWLQNHLWWPNDPRG